MSDKTDNGTALVIDQEKLGPDGWKLVGGIEALNAAEMTVKKIRENSAVAQERMFLGEIADLLKSFADQHRARLVHLAQTTGAVERTAPLTRERAEKLN